MTYLLDVNFLVALFDPRHLNHENAHGWLEARTRLSWATCPITENGCVRVLSAPAYPTVITTPNEMRARLSHFCERPDHQFWPDDLSILDSLGPKTAASLIGHAQITDFYLAALAHRHGGVVVTFDASLVRSLKGSELARAVEVAE